LIVLSPLILSGHFRSELIFRLNSLWIGWICGAYLKGAELRVLANTPFAVPVLDAMISRPQPPRLRRLVYDRIDDFTAFAWAPPFSQELERRLLDRADTVIAGTGEIADSAPGTEFIACGVDYERFAISASTPMDIAGLPRPIIGYFGTISERLDMELIAQIAERFSDASVVMVGPVHLATVDTPTRSNIHYLGLKPHQALPGYAQHFDVALIPFRLTPATMKLNPVKTLEYLAAGAPVVSTAIPDVKRFFADVVAIAETRDEFIELVAKSLQQPDDAMRARGRALARASSWDEMVRRINVRLLDNVAESHLPSGMGQSEA
jgi:glycosyltransferase involved in cell wall biosynthesis